MPQTSAQAQERLIKGAPAQLTPLPKQGGGPREDANLVVDNVMIDRTAENAVLARELAITDARREAFRKLAEKHMTPASYATFRMPDDRTIATLVQDFEIGGEQLSATRYVAKFTVRFRDGVRRYMDLPYAPRPYVPDEVATAAGHPFRSGDRTAGWGEDGGAQDAAGVFAGSAVLSTGSAPRTEGGLPRMTGTLLLLPYYENMAGQTLLWEDPNPWRDVWQRMPGNGAGISRHLMNRVMVPLGDIADISAGAANALWSGDYRTLDRLRANYGAAHVVVAVANKSGAHMSIDVYVYESGRLDRRSTLRPYVGERGEAEAWQQGMYDVLAYLQSPMPPPAGVAAVENISRSVVTQPQQGFPARGDDGLPAGYAMAEAAVPARAEEESYAAGNEIEAMLSFSDFNAWMNVQRRFSAMTPPVRIDIRSLSRNTARFVMRYEGGLHALQGALAAQGIAMAPSREITTAAGTPVYDLRLYP